MIVTEELTGRKCEEILINCISFRFTKATQCDEFIRFLFCINGMVIVFHFCFYFEASDPRMCSKSTDQSRIVDNQIRIDFHRASKGIFDFHNFVGF